ncbi:MAG: VanZ family protein [Polyangiaceae bacterium]|nr:VanZ family protein [Polyangiaceae bacterium]
MSAYSGLLPTKSILFPHYDLVMHFLLVGMFGFFLDGSFAHKKLTNAPFFPRLGPSIALLLAATEETLQRFSPRRSSSWSDFIANATGILICSWLALKLSESRAQRAKGVA